MGSRPADYLLTVGRQAVGVIEAKPRGTTLSEIEMQSQVTCSMCPNTYLQSKYRFYLRMRRQELILFLGI